MRWILPLPPTTNHIWRYTARGGKPCVYLTSEAKGWKEHAQWVLRRGKPIKEPVEVYLYFRLKFDRDVDNCKLVMDALEDTVLCNDSQVVALHIFKEKVKDGPCCEVEVNKL